MKPCSCGKDVRLRATKLRHGIYHYIEHMDCTPVCVPGIWDCVMSKPYPKRIEQRASQRMLDRWEQQAALDAAGGRHGNL